MDEMTLLLFIEQIIACNDRKKIEYNLLQLADVLKKNGAENNFINMVETLRKFSDEVTALSQKATSKGLTKADLEDAIIRGKQKGVKERIPVKQARC